MSNGNIAVPQFAIECMDRRRVFCLDLRAFRSMEVLLAEETGNPEYSVYEDFNWYSRRITDIALVIWAGFLTDAKKDKDPVTDNEIPWTIEKAEGVIDFIGMIEATEAIQKSISRVLSPEQIEAAKARAEKKTLKPNVENLQSLQAKQLKRGRPKKQK